MNSAAVSAGCRQLCPHLSFSGSGECSLLCQACGCVCVGFRVSAVIQRPLRSSSWSHSVPWLRCPDCSTHCPTVPRSLLPSVTRLLGLPYTVCPQAVAAIWSANKRHSKVCPNFCTVKVRAGTRLKPGSKFTEVQPENKVGKRYWKSLKWAVGSVNI